MTFADWAAAPLADGVHRIGELPLDVLHPLRHGLLGIELEVQAGLITACRFDVHANHRADEKLLEVRDVRQGLALIDRHGWLTAPFAETLYARVVEQLLGITVSPRAAALRELALALNAVAVDALWEHLDASLTGDATGDALGRRADAIDELETLSGARMHTTYVRIGGVADDIDHTQLERLAEHSNPRVSRAAQRVTEADGAIAVTLPKVLRIPQADGYDEIDTPHGTLGLWLVGRGDKVPHRLHLRTAGFTALAALEREAAGLTPEAFLMRLARTRLTLGEVAR